MIYSILSSQPITVDSVRPRLWNLLKARNQGELWLIIDNMTPEPAPRPQNRPRTKIPDSPRCGLMFAEEGRFLTPPL
ncbi:MAG: hypothetical protein FWE14_02480 [Lachnospiraceae bacterium]|nr:hypothetical protein [Lachnospiraceae bacterium]